MTAGRKSYAEKGLMTKAEEAKRKTESIRRWIVTNLPSSADQAISVDTLVRKMGEDDLIHFAPALQRVSANMARLFRLGLIHRRRKIVGCYINPRTGEEIPIRNYHYWRVLN